MSTISSHGGITFTIDNNNNDGSRAWILDRRGGGAGNVLMRVDENADVTSYFGKIQCSTTWNVDSTGSASLICEFYQGGSFIAGVARDGRAIFSVGGVAVQRTCYSDPNSIPIAGTIGDTIFYTDDADQPTVTRYYVYVGAGAPNNWKYIDFT